MSELTDQRRLLSAAVKPLLNEGETVTVAVAESEFEKGLEKRRFSVAVSVGPAADEASAERLDELLSGPVRDALIASDLHPTVTRTSGYQAVRGPEGESLLGATFTAQLFN